MNEVLRKGNVARLYRVNNNGTSGNGRATNEIWDSNSAESICNNAVSIVLDVSTSTAQTTTTNMIPTAAELRTRLRRTFPDPLRRRIISDHGFDPINLRDLALINSLREVYSDDLDMPRSRFRFISPPDTANNNYPRTKTYYKFKVFPWTYFKVTLDRLKLLALLDRNLTIYETVLSIFLGILVSVLGAILLYLGFYEDILAFIFCFIIASCQYSLMKSVQPDAASPTHGFNRLIAYSRPVYFCLCCFMVILLDLHVDNPKYVVFSSFTNVDIIVAVRDFLVKFILFFPVLFSLGLFPQINTFTMYLLEQIDMHIFGGNAMSSLLASFYCVFRSVMAVFILSGVAYGGLSERKASQHILFSIFCAALMAGCYHFSRSASDPSHLWNLLKRHLWPPDVYRKAPKKLPEEERKHEEDNSETKKEKVEPPPPSADDLVDPLPEKLQKTINARLKNDVIMCSSIAILTFVIHASTVFTALQHELSPVLWCITACFGFVLHYIIPQLRKQLPWLCIARPVLRSREHDMHQITVPAKIMWFEEVGILKFYCLL